MQAYYLIFNLLKNGVRKKDSLSSFKEQKIKHMFREKVLFPIKKYFRSLIRTIRELYA